MNYESTTTDKSGIFNSIQKTKNSEDNAKSKHNFLPSNVLGNQDAVRWWGRERKKKKEKMAALDSKLVNALNNG